MVLDASLLNTQHYKVRIKGKVEQSREEVAPSPTPWCSSYRKGSLRVTLDYGRQLYLLTYYSQINLRAKQKYEVLSATRYISTRWIRRAYLRSDGFYSVCSRQHPAFMVFIHSFCLWVSFECITKSEEISVYNTKASEQKKKWLQIIFYSFWKRKKHKRKQNSVLTIQHEAA